jgi:hypothetical protein
MKGEIKDKGGRGGRSVTKGLMDKEMKGWQWINCDGSVEDDWCLSGCGMESSV